MLCQLLGRAIVLVREDQLSLAIGRRGQNVRLASKLVGWDIEIMTSEELDELIEKAVAAFTRIEGVDTDLAEKLVEQGILSFDDLSVMEIDDLVNTIEDLNEELAVEIVGRAEVLAEEQADEMPRRKGARPQQPATPARRRRARPDGDEAGEPTAIGRPDHRSTTSSPTTRPAERRRRRSPERSADADEDADDDDSSPTEDEELRDLALAAEEADLDPDGHEVTSAPSDADQSETDPDRDRGRRIRALARKNSWPTRPARGRTTPTRSCPRHHRLVPGTAGPPRPGPGTRTPRGSQE